MATEAGIHTAIDTIVSRLQAATGASYHYDLSASNRVRRGPDLDGPQGSYSVWVGSSAIEMQEDQGQACFGRSRFRVTIPIRCFLAVVDSSRQPLIANLVSDIKRAVTTTDRSLGSAGWGVEFGRVSIWDGRDAGWDAHAVADVGLTFTLDVDDEQV